MVIICIPQISLCGFVIFGLLDIQTKTETWVIESTSNNRSSVVDPINCFRTRVNDCTFCILIEVSRRNSLNFRQPKKKTPLRKLGPPGVFGPAHANLSFQALRLIIIVNICRFRTVGLTYYSLVSSGSARKIVALLLCEGQWKCHVFQHPCFNFMPFVPRGIRSWNWQGIGKQPVEFHHGQC